MADYWFYIVLLGILFPSLLFGGKFIGALIDRFTSPGAVRDFLHRLNDSVTTAVQVVNQEYVKSIKEGLDNDGKLSEEEKAEAKKRALDKLKGYIGENGTTEIKKIIGVKNVDQYLSDKIEAKVFESGEFKPALRKTASATAVAEVIIEQKKEPTPSEPIKAMEPQTGTVSKDDKAPEGKW